MILRRKPVEGDDEISRGNVLRTQLRQGFGGGINALPRQAVDKFRSDMLLRRDPARGDLNHNVPFRCSPLEKLTRYWALNRPELTNEQDAR